MSLIVTFLLTFVLGYTGAHYTTSSWGIRSPITIVVGVVFGILAAFLATLAVGSIATL